jgi:uncharacterized damage-inducible protein DinB
MNASFKPVFDELERQREVLFSLLKNLPEEKLAASPYPGKWSISQIVTHLVTSEKLSLAYMKKKSLGIDGVKNSGITETLRLWLLIISQRIPVKYKAPKVVTENTPPAMPLTALVEEWSALRNELKQFLERIEDRHVRKVLYKHPLAGRLDVRQAMIFFREHINHHKPQIERLLE